VSRVKMTPMSTSVPDDLLPMRHALRLAARGLGRVAPNPAVGCVIVGSDGVIVGRGWTQPGGRPHAETVALAQAGTSARGATAYVTLEPCAHQGLTPPCVDALIAAQVARVVGAIRDPDPRVSGAGYQRLKDAGIAVTQAVLEEDARALNAGFFKRVTAGRPLVGLKIAESADGYVAGPAGSKRWITSEWARRHSHLLRAEHDAILIGIGTVLADDPLLTCRLAGLENRSPSRVVLDSRLRLPPGSQLARSAREVPVILFTATGEGGAGLTRAGVTIERVAGDVQGRPDLAAVLKALGARGMTRLLVEGGPTVHGALLQRNLADLAYIYRAPARLNGGLRSRLGSASQGRLLSRESLGPDVLESYALTV
jgi:diaminohydroxyphosphoribosylaminopyrimidine deaminase / 5-amino-6-(5-phosphoribosylamino)uracil reductase